MQCLCHPTVRYVPNHLILFPRNPPHLRPSRLPLVRPAYQHGFPRRRTILHVPAALLPPLVFSGLVLALWTWKCCMMILFQNKIIYMPGLPPNARREKISDYARLCGGITWREEKIVSTDGTEIALCVATVEDSAKSLESPNPLPVYIVYFQGNASSLPSRLPLLSPVLRLLRAGPPKAQNGKKYPKPCGIPVRYIMVCVSYRGYWRSKGRPSERGITKDAAATLEWIGSQHGEASTQHIPVILWGQSIGAAVATTLAARHSTFPRNIGVKMLILETPFTNVRDMLVAIYPQKWLPYRHLWPFLRNHLDSCLALKQISQQPSKSLPEVVILEAGKDELVPKSHGDALERRCVDLGLGVRRHMISEALHTEVMSRPEGRSIVAKAIKTVATSMDLS